MSSTLSPPAWAIFLLVVAADVLDLLSTTVTRIRPGAAMTLMAGLGLLLAGLVDGTSEWTARALAGTVAGAVALAVFGWQQARTSRPLPERSLFGNRGFVAGLGMGCCFGAVFAVALGDVNSAQAGSAGGVLNAVQQIVNRPAPPSCRRSTWPPSRRTSRPAAFCPACSSPWPSPRHAR